MEYFSTNSRGDGFGAQYQNFVFCILFAELNNVKYAHNPIKNIEHNYDNDPLFIGKLEQLMNIKNNYTNIDEITDSKIIQYLSHEPVYRFVENNIDFCLQSDSMKRCKTHFWSNKIRYFTNQPNIINVAIHIRSVNIGDGINARKYIDNKYFLYVIHRIREKYVGSQLKFHIFSQGNDCDFSMFFNPDTILHLNEDICDTFIALVSADILVTSESSLSYTAACLSDGIIYYLPFWHKPARHWITVI